MLSTARHQERAFSLVEVIVAMVIAAIVVGALAMATTSQSSNGVRSGITQRQAAIVDALLERAKGDSEWSKLPACRQVGQECDITALVPLIGPDEELSEEPDGVIKHDFQVVAIGYDDTSDGTGNDDRDGIVPDRYEITATDTVTAPGILEDPQVKSATATIDMGSRARRGGLEVIACSVGPQIDERMSIGACGGSSGDNTGTMEPSPSCGSPDLFCSSFSAAGASRTIVTATREGGMQLTINGPLPSTAAAATLVTDGSGVARTTNLEPGTYTLAATPPAGMKPWKARSQPADGRVVVREGQTTSAMQVFRPEAPTLSVQINVRDVTDPRNHAAMAGTPKPLAIKLIPVPANREPLAIFGPDGGWTSIPEGTASGAQVPIVALETGLYSGWALLGPGDRTTQFDHARAGQDFVWVDPGGAHVPNILELTLSHCDEERRLELVRTLCLPQAAWCFLRDGTRIAPCEDNEIPVDTGALGSGGT